ncbi:MAG TPA: FAD-binding oxidoreductase [Xanthobacteraceae bacterium]|jgi:FAD/FMN-containing dehydrogenase|nr:FAD-binding oxidoreductase [Xanthobacteraceae bacterium]
MNKPVTPDLVTRFTKIVGPRYAITDAHDQDAYLVEGRGLYKGKTPVVLRPGSVDEVSAIMKLAFESGTPVVPQGGNTGLVGGGVPFESGDEIVLSLTRLDKIRDLDPLSNAMTCEAGVILANAQAAAADADRLFPLSLGAQGSCTIGGNLSTNAGGTGALAYGVARDLVLGIEVVLADGRVMRGLNKLKKDNTGYDLRHLFIGAEGTLGVITAAVLKLFPKPKAVETAIIGLPSPQAALALFNLARERAGGAITGFELMPRIGLDFLFDHMNGFRDPMATRHPWYVLAEFSSQKSEGLRDTMESILAEGVEQGLVVDAVIASNLEQAKYFWSMREMLPEAQKPVGGSIKHDISVPVATVPDFIEEAIAAVVAFLPGSRPVAFGHLGDGNVHFNVSQPEGADKDEFIAGWHAMNEVVHAITAKYGGSISAEHGIGRLKRDLLPSVKDPVAMDLMRTLKRTLDPKNILNPGKVV